ncbi:AN1-type zinc finger protein 1 [Bemisia tabaci]
MEFPNLGAQCAVPTCKQLNFLPTECDHCHLAFCGEHSFVDHHGCTKFESNQVHPEELPSAEKNYHKCSFEGCSSSSPIAMICPHCRIHFCLSHRYHGCMDSKEQQKDRRRKEYLKKKVTQENFKTAKEETDKQVEMKLQTAEKQPEKAAMVQKIRFMKIKSKSLGDNKIPGSDRVYFSVHPPLKSDVSKSTPLFGAKDYTIGKAIDIFASKLKVLNENHKKEAPKLRLFKHMTGSILTHDMKETIDSLLKKDIVYNGDTLILEYVNVEDLDNNTPTLKDLDSLSRYTGSTV